MDNGKESSIDRKKDWKDQLADVDKKCGWHPGASLNWDDEFDDDEGQDCRQAVQGEDHLEERPKTPLREIIFVDIQDNSESAIIDEDDEEYYSAVEYMDDAPSLPASSSRQRTYNGAHAFGVGDVDGARAQENTRKESPEIDYQLRPGLVTYVEHRFGPNIQYEDRCLCHEWLVDLREQRNRSERMYFAQYGTCLPQDACVLREYPQADMPGTEDVDKPMLTITTPDGETLHPHDERVWPQSSPSSAPSPMYEIRS